MNLFEGFIKIFLMVVLMQYFIDKVLMPITRFVLKHKNSHKSVNKEGNISKTSSKEELYHNMQDVIATMEVIIDDSINIYESMDDNSDYDDVIDEITSYEDKVDYYKLLEASSLTDKLYNDALLEIDDLKELYEMLTDDLDLSVSTPKKTSSYKEKPEYEDYNFEEEDLEEDDYYYEDDDMEDERED